MTSILAVETSTAACSVALSMGDARYTRYSEEPRSHTRLIMSMIDEVLAEADLKVGALDSLAVTVGPGSFTGLRIGFSTVQGLAFGAGLSVVPVSTLEVMAQTYRRKYDPSDLQSGKVLSVLDARMGEFNCGAYLLDDQAQFVPLIKDQLLGHKAALELVETIDPCVVVGDTRALFFNVANAQHNCQPLYPDARDVLEIALVKHSRGCAVPIASLDLVYLRGTEAWKKHTKLRTA